MLKWGRDTKNTELVNLTRFGCGIPTIFLYNFEPNLINMKILNVTELRYCVGPGKKAILQTLV